MKKLLSLVLCLVLCLSLVSCGGFTEEKNALVGSKWFSGKDTSNSIVVWNFYDESVERAEYFFDGNGMHDSTKSVGEYKVQKDAIKVSFDSEDVMIPYVFENGKITLEAGKFFSPEDVEKELQGFWTLRVTDFILGSVTSNEYNVQIDNGTIRIEEAADALYGAPGEYYYYGPYEGTYTIGDGKFESDADHTDRYFFNVYKGQVRLFHYGKEMKRGDGFPGPDGYVFN